MRRHGWGAGMTHHDSWQSAEAERDACVISRDLRDVMISRDLRDIAVAVHGCLADDRQQL